MAYSFSRRNFIKGAGITALAVASSGLFAGCGGSSNSGSSTVPAKTETTVGGAKVKLLGYRDGWFSEADKLVSKIIGGNTDVTWIAPVFQITNNTESTIDMGNTVSDLLSTLGAMVIAGDYSEIENLKNADFDINCPEGTVHHGDVGYVTKEDGTSDYVNGKLKPGKTGFIKLCCIAPSDWSKMTITYKPSFASNVSKTFVLSKGSDKYTD